MAQGHSRFVYLRDYGIGLLFIFLSIQAVRSLIHKSLSKFEAVYEGYSCHLAGNTPSLDPRIYEVDFFLSLLSDHDSDLRL